MNFEKCGNVADITSCKCKGNKTGIQFWCWNKIRLYYDGNFYYLKKSLLIVDSLTQVHVWHKSLIFNSKVK